MQLGDDAAAFVGCGCSGLVVEGRSVVVAAGSAVAAFVAGVDGAVVEVAGVGSGWGVVEGGAGPVASGLGQQRRGFGLAVLGEADEGDGDFGEGFALAAADGVDDAGVVPVGAELPDEGRQGFGLDAGGGLVLGALIVGGVVLATTPRP